jgi:uncharacterized phage protein (TIGR02218 family)
MTFATLETSGASGSPVELYEFTRGTSAWRYTSGAEEVTHNLRVYTPAPIQRGGIELGQEMGRAALEVRLARGLDVADDAVAGIPSEVMALTIYRLHRGDAEVAVAWMGRVLTADYRGVEVVLHCEPVFTSLRRIGLRRLYQLGCPHVLYGSGCGVDPLDHQVQGAVSAISGVTVTVPAADTPADGHFSGGVLAWSLYGAIQRRMIAGHAGATLSLLGQPFGLEVGGTVILLPGCDHILATCSAKFDNSDRFGGFPNIPKKNPFGGDPIY